MTQPFNIPEEHELKWLIDHGFPTFDEFKKNPDRWRLGKEQLFESIDRSTDMDRKNVAKQRLYWRDGKTTMSLEKLQAIAASEGYSLSDIDILPFREINGSGTGKDVIHVRVYPRWELVAMGVKVPNA